MSDVPSESGNTTSLLSPSSLSNGNDVAVSPSQTSSLHSPSPSPPQSLRSPPVEQQQLQQQQQQQDDDVEASAVRPPGERFTIAHIDQRRIQRFGVSANVFSFKIKEPSIDINPIVWLEDALRDIHAYLVSLCASENDLIGISLSSDNFAHGPAGLSLRPVNDFVCRDLVNLFGALAQSNEQFSLNDTFSVKATFVSLPRGSGNSRKKNLTLNCLKKRSIVSIRNDDNLCLPRALVVAEAHAAMKSTDSAETRAQWAIIRDGRRPAQRQRAELLLRDSRVTIPQDGCGFPEIDKFQIVHYTAKNIAIVVYDKATLGSGVPPFYDGRNLLNIRDPNRVINILHDSVNNHFDVILNINGVTDTRFFCEPCNKTYGYVDQHRCSDLCPRCFARPSCLPTVGALAEIRCDECRRLFYSQACFNNHKRIGSHKRGSRVCDVVKLCAGCNTCYNRNRRRHECGVFFCQTCRTLHSRNEACYMQPIRVNARRATADANKKRLYIFYDFETRQDEAYRGHASTTIHVPNLCVVQQVCTDCLHVDDITRNCGTCGVREYVFHEQPVKRLIDIAIRGNESRFVEIVCVAHNARGFDAQFILRELALRYTRVLPSCILNGQSIVTLQYGRTTFIDSLNFFHMKLSALPAAFGLPESAKKGYFPHLFNTVANNSYVGPIPEASFYSPDSMSHDERARFFAWYAEMRALSDNGAYIFDLRKEMIDYCRMDVEILRRACLAFRQIFLTVSGVIDPFAGSVTIAAACSRVFRTKFLKPGTIGLIPPNGYRRADKHSQKAVEWLLYCERDIGREIIHAGRSREFRLTEGFRVDGFLPPQQQRNIGDNDDVEVVEPGAKGIVFEFQGCYAHGCPRCFRTNREVRLTYQRTMNEAYENTCAKTAKMRALGYEVREMWECDFDEERRINPEINAYLRAHPLISQLTLDPHEAFFGGRTENITTCYNVTNTERVKYTDICSLYPWVCKRGKFPLGHPRIYVGDECNELTNGRNDDLSRVEGLVKCSVLPPRSLFLPVLPMRANGRLLFPLCRSCCCSDDAIEQQQQVGCTHETVDERELRGTWVVDELRKAVELGYRIIKIHIIWQYEVTTYDQSTGQGGLFVDYVNLFLKIKQEASGWPSWCVDEESKDRYVREYEAAEGIRLQPEQIERNAGLRAVAKLCLNSFWGKFAQRSNLRQTSIVKSREELLRLVLSPEKEVFDLLSITDDTMFITWKLREEAVISSPHVNVVIAAYVTAQARLKLYQHLQLLGRRVLYYDTDSCVFVCNDDDQLPKNYEPQIGTLLGDMTDELASNYGPGTYITTFVSGGPKFYAYRTFTPSTGLINECCKVKGISLTYANSLKINFDSIKSLLDNYFIDDVDDDNPEIREQNYNYNNNAEVAAADVLVPAAAAAVAPNRGENFIRLNFRSIRRTREHEIVTRNEKKSCFVVLKKRRYISQALSLPFGYKEE